MAWIVNFLLGFLFAMDWGLDYWFVIEGFICGVGYRTIRGVGCWFPIRGLICSGLWCGLLIFVGVRFTVGYGVGRSGSQGGTQRVYGGRWRSWWKVLWSPTTSAFLGPSYTFRIVWHQHEVGHCVYPVWAHPTHRLGSTPLALRTKEDKMELPVGLDPGTNI